MRYIRNYKCLNTVEIRTRKKKHSPNTFFVIKYCLSHRNVRGSHVNKCTTLAVIFLFGATLTVGSLRQGHRTILNDRF